MPDLPPFLRDAAMEEYCQPSGTGQYTLLGATGSHLRLSALYTTGAMVRYEASDDVANSEWVTGIYDAGANTLTRTTIWYSSNGGAPVNWSGATRAFIRPLCLCKPVTSQGIQFNPPTTAIDFLGQGMSSVVFPTNF